MGDLDIFVSQALERMQKLRPPKLVKTFVPAGRSSYNIYAVSLREHKGVTKVGQTSRWGARLKAYQS